MPSSLALGRGHQAFCSALQTQRPRCGNPRQVSSTVQTKPADTNLLGRDLGIGRHNQSSAFQSNGRRRLGPFQEMLPISRSALETVERMTCEPLWRNVLGAQKGDFASSVRPASQTESGYGKEGTTERRRGRGRSYTATNCSAQRIGADYDTHSRTVSREWPILETVPPTRKPSNHCGRHETNPAPPGKHITIVNSRY